MLKTLLSNKINVLFLIIISVIIFYAYLPTLLYDFVAGDQWRAFQYSVLDGDAIEKALKCYYSRIYFDIGTGRPLCSLGEILEHALVGQISDFSLSRPLILVLVVITALCFGLALSPALGGYRNGTAIGTLFVFSPGYAYMYYIGLSVIMHLAVLVFATISYILIRQAIENTYSYKLLLPSSLLFLLACLIYPSWAFIVFIFSLIDYLFVKKYEKKIKLKHLFMALPAF